MYKRQFRYRLNAAAEALGIDAKASVNEDEEFALVTFDGKTRHKRPSRDMAKTEFELQMCIRDRDFVVNPSRLLLVKNRKTLRTITASTTTYQLGRHNVPGFLSLIHIC